MTVNLEQLRHRFSGMGEKRRYYEWKSEQPGRLVRHETWRHTYLAHPYLVGAPDERVAERFRNVFLNVMEIGPTGQLQPVPLTETDEFMQVFTHLLEEYDFRSGGRPSDEIIQSARDPIVKYFENGTPIGFKMFEKYKPPASPILVKYGKKEFLEPMIKTGALRLANASLYNDEGLLNSIRDDETSRTFCIPTYQERLRGLDEVVVQGHHVKFENDDLVLPLVFNDYYLFSLCNKIHYRMPTDFNADSAIVIKDPELFRQRLISSFMAQHPDWIVFEGPVTCYDPYRDYSKFKIPEMAKHFGYAYQKEFRIVFRPKHSIPMKLEPLFLSIGSMEDYADLVSL